MDEKENTRELIVVDVKRYKKVKKALKDSEARYRLLFENVPIGIYRSTTDGRIIDANPALIKMLGFTDFAELAARNDAEDFAEANSLRADFIARLECDDEVRGLESVWVKKDGSFIHVRENAKLTCDNNGQTLLEGTVEDISLSKQVEETQKNRAKEMEILNCLICSGNQAESLNELLDKILDYVTTLLDFNAAAIYMFDHHSQKVTMVAQKDLPAGFFLEEKCMSITEQPFAKVLLRGQAVFADNIQDSEPELAQKWHWRSAASIPLTSKGRIIGALNVASLRRFVFLPEEKNILDLIGKEAGTLISKIQTEMALRESEKYYRTLIETSPDIIVVVDLDGTVVMANQRLFKIGGYLHDDVIGKSAFDFVVDDDQTIFNENIARFIEKKKLGRIEYRVKKKDGSIFPIELTASLLADAQGQPKWIIVIARDITQRKQAEEKLLAYQEQLRALSSELVLIEEKERRRIASELHDQIGQNLILCKLKLATLEKSISSAPASGELAAIRQLLEQSIHDARSLIFDLSPPILYELGFTAALEWLAERTQEQFHIPVEFASKHFSHSLGDDQQVILFQIVRELLINVGKHSQATQAKVILSVEKPCIKIQVNDNGVGFDTAQVFNPKGHNRGFGFFSVRERLNYIGGELEIKSKTGQGTQVILKVPRRKNSKSRKEAHA